MLPVQLQLSCKHLTREFLSSHREILPIFSVMKKEIKSSLKQLKLNSFKLYFYEKDLNYLIRLIPHLADTA